MTHPQDTATRVARLLLGAGFTVFGLNGFLQFLPQAAPPPEAGAFLGALAATGYMFPLIKVIELSAGLMLLTNFRVPFALLLLAPVAVNIIFYHAFLDPAGIVPGAALTALGIFLATRYFHAFAPLFASSAKGDKQRLIPPRHVEAT